MNTIDPSTENLLLKNQLCFPLYAAARKIVAAYTPFLKEIGLTYTQYVTMMVLWEVNSISVKDLGEKLYLDSGTLTPLLKKLEHLQLIERTRSHEDERIVIVTITESGLALRAKALNVPLQMSCKLDPDGTCFSREEIDKLRNELYKIIDILK